jgi:hypothetical protein
LVPVSVVPWRDAERTSTRVPVPHGVSRTTMSSVKPNHQVVSVASRRPLPGSLRDDGPALVLGDEPRAIEDQARRLRDDERRQVGIVLALQLVHLARAGQRVAVAGAGGRAPRTRAGSRGRS